MDEKECDNVIESVKWTEPFSLIFLAALECINFLVIGGNCLVITAVFCSSKLRSVTNFLVVNLAVADLLVGLAVLPFSATWEVYKVWIFGGVWCRVWLSLDVWTCTASILTLCAISLDRYIAVTRPVTYIKIMSTERTKIIIVGIWVLSFVICCPPLIGWKETTDGQYLVPENNLDLQSEEKPTEYIMLVKNTSSIYKKLTDNNKINGNAVRFSCPWKCELTNDRGYVLYSAIGSFFIPMLVMLFFYWRIYHTAVRTTRAIHQGYRTEKVNPKDNTGSRTDDSQLVLRMHRGRADASKPSYLQRNPHSLNSMSSSQNLNRNTKDKIAYQDIPKRATSMRIRRQPQDHVNMKVSFPSSESMLHLKNMETSSLSSSNVATSQAVSTSYLSILKDDHGSSSSNIYHADDMLQTTNNKNSKIISFPFGKTSENVDMCKKKSKKCSIKFQIKRFRVETKAAKTLAIIVGGFIVCWLPFFTMYLLRSFCETCIPPTLFSVLFWLGYCNSAINPVIYALFSNDFRIAFKRIVFRCMWTRSAFRASENFEKIAARAFFAPAAFQKTLSGCSDDVDSPDCV